MKQFIKVFFVYYVVFLFMGCETLIEGKQNLNLEQFNKLGAGIAQKSEVEQLLGKPDRIDGGQWIYESDGSEKMWVSFENNIVNAVSMSVWEEDKFKSVESLLPSFTGSWTVLKEPMSNPHLAPSLCYLEDLENGKRIRINSYKKNVEYIAKWKPTKDQGSIKDYLYRNVGKEFCIANSCSKVTDPDAWEYNQCAWIEKIVAKDQEAVRNKKLKPKKLNKSNNF